MIFHFYAVVLTLFLCDYVAAALCIARNPLSKMYGYMSCCSNKDSREECFNIDDFKYAGDPIKFSCIHEDQQLGFDVYKSDEDDMMELAAKLDNGRGISLFFHGIGNKVSIDGYFFNAVKEWFSVSDKNICIITYVYAKPTTLLTLLIDVNKMVRTKRLDFVAKQARDLVLNVREKCVESGKSDCLKSMSQVDVIGFSFGSYIGSRTCEFLYEKTKERVKTLLGLDPPRTTIFLDNSPHFKRGDAEYTQVLHTSNNFGTSKKIGDVDIYVHYKFDTILLNLLKKHGLSVFLHIATATKRLYLIAEENGNGTMIANVGQKLRPLKSNEVLLGVYGTFNQRKKEKTFELNLVDKTKLFWDNLSGLVNVKYFG
ncbi:uncharacterized protein LOC116337272 [Contarinia nasturtii]|uniref:uncharacterized protein LOC116337272 n=1 Tax=Contarinia nasturtii TaxID=265458 RepID=UPI0012D4B741|nr:uncharacterized protein LOC116337272 [Contarinia nasturtii]